MNYDNMLYIYTSRNAKAVRQRKNATAKESKELLELLDYLVFEDLMAVQETWDLKDHTVQKERRATWDELVLWDQKDTEGTMVLMDSGAHQASR